MSITRASLLGSLTEQNGFHNFESAYSYIESHASYNSPDALLPFSSIDVLPDTKKDVVICYGGLQHHLTDWSCRQLGALLGFRWKQWFKQPNISSGQIAEEISRRTRASQYNLRVRSRRTSIENTDSVGILRAFLSPQYSPIDDIYIFDALYEHHRSRLQDWVCVSKRFGTEYQTDRSSHVTLLFKEPINVGSSDAPDWCYVGLQIRNSEVGFCSLSVKIMFIRAVCSNGMILSSSEHSLLYLPHRGEIITALDETMRGLFSTFDERIGSSIDKIRYVKSLEPHWTEDDLKKEFERILLGNNLGRNMVPTLLQAHAQEPLLTPYGIIQAITRAAQDETDHERRYVLEAAAGEYLLEQARR